MFQEYLERQERVRAVQFQTPDQVGDLVKLFNPISFSFESHPDLKITIQGRPDMDTMYDSGGQTIVINRGDYVIKGRDYNGHYSGYRAIERHEFVNRFENADALREFLYGPSHA